MRTPAWLVLALCCLLQSGAAEPLPPEFTTVLVEDSLALALWPSVVWADGAVYAIGGDYWESSGDLSSRAEILRVDPSGGTTNIGQLPQPRSGMAAASIGSIIYGFGGGSDGWLSTPLDSNGYRIDSKTGQVNVLPNVFPHGRTGMTAVAVQGQIYLFGGAGDVPGSNSVSCAKDIFRFDPIASALHVVAATLPFDSCFAAAATDGTMVYLTGFAKWGYTATPEVVSQNIIRFDPATESIAATSALATDSFRYQTSMTWDGENFYLVGGNEIGEGHLDSVLRFSPNDMSVEQIGTLPYPVWGHSVFTGCGIMVVGGMVDDGNGEDYLDGLIFSRDVIQVGPSYPCKVEADFAWTAALGCTVASLQFAPTVNFPTGNAYLWDFGDGESSSAAQPTHTYDEDGEYAVSLTVTHGAWSATVEHIAEIALPTHCPPIIHAMQPVQTGIGGKVVACPTGTSGRGGELAFHVEGAPESAEVDAAGCASWVADAVGVWPCIKFTVTETPGGLQDSTCLRVSVRDRAEPVVTTDGDRDGIEDWADNCPGIPNREQEDFNTDGIGDACSEGTPATSMPGAVPDVDEDGRPDAQDLCPGIPDDARDLDRDGYGDACDADADGDGALDQGVPGQLLDNCPMLTNADQADRDGDGQGDACEDTVTTAAAANRVEQEGPARTAPAGPAALLIALCLGAGLRRVDSRRPR